MPREVVVLGACRTPVARFLGALQNIPAYHLGSLVIAEVLKRSDIQGEDVDEVIMGNVLQHGQGQNPGRLATIRAGLPESVPAITINKLCGSGMKAVHLASQAILLGDAEVIVAGGFENMTLAPFTLAKQRQGYRMGDATLVDSLLGDGLNCGVLGYHMGHTAENIAARYGITREEQDRFALESQRRAVAAIAAGNFKEEIVPVEVPAKKGQTALFDTDEHPRADTSFEGLQALKPAFKPDGTVTAGNASGMNDAAAALVLASGEFAESRGLKPLARIVAYASAALDPAYMGLGPIFATHKVMAKSGMTVEEMDVVEANEAFASQALATIGDLGLDMSKTNLCGGAIALGHPIGASGARVLTTLIHALRREGGRYGLATMCIGGGQGIATIVEAL
ncbi:MAG: acetyl-CoA C-acetyltransferase [Actinobacteria bacterium]|nr:acetyl-CoA C-acetyltransferase [Actinomycetota bacterium]